jgi:hypothetical protein
MNKFRNRSMFAALGAAAITALGVGGAALAQSNGPAASRAPVQHPPAQQGADKPDAPEAGGKADAPDKGEKPESRDRGEAPEKPGGDGPGGHADETGPNANANANHEAQGQE